MRSARPKARRGYALLAVLIVVVVLSLAAYRYADSMTAENSVAIRTTESAQAKAFATAGVHVALGKIADPATLAGELGHNPYDNQAFSNVAVGEETGPRGGGRFSLYGVGDSGAGIGEGRYLAKSGVTDESGKLNINALILLDPTGQVLFDALMKLPNMTEDIADAIVDWVDSDDTQRPAGAESGYYSSLPSPYKAKNGPLNTIEELLLVAGIAQSPGLLFGNDRNRNGKLDPGEEDGSDLNRGWADFLTVYGRELDADPEGNARANLNDTQADLVALADKLAQKLGQEMADYVIAARLYGTSATQQTVRLSFSSSGSGGATVSPTGTVVVTMTAKTGSGSSGSSGSDSKSQTVTGGPAELRAAVQASLDAGTPMKGKLNSLMALANTQVTLPKPADAPMDAPTVVVPSPLNDQAKLKAALPLLLDWTTTRTGFEMTPRVNVNTAPAEVLAAIPGLTAENVSTIVATRDSLDPTDPATTTGAWLVTQANIPFATFRNLERYVTGRTMTYRIHSVGYFARGGPVSRVEAVVDTNQGHPRILYFRDLTDLGKGFELVR